MAYIFRPAAAEDIPVLARLIIDLYQSELPGALTGSQSAQEALMRFTLEANGPKALSQRYMLCDEQGQVCGTGMLEFPGEPAFERAPDGTIAAAFRLMGVKPTLTLLGTVARSLLGVYKHADPRSALIHSVVIQAGSRSKGAGQILVAGLEEKIRERGLPRARLQVLGTNTGAQRFYLRLGYREIWRLGGWQAALSWPSLVMQKDLA